ncbi:tetratricopeptide repeat protein [Polaribacter sp. MSW13]|uniref:Tetratricopeptide repeat protein n=1 Tax=Polaribacter marinus TaxID=2916838 RepID=A0A9X1VNK3_9FLAO|nr:tetratricopeptide repeat protein [Polaribacter marinus]MCI2229368.1 tetratricopeptide repeat protein [Polaribacter marinus]
MVKFLILFFSIIFSVNAQKNKPEFTIQIDSVLKTKPITYKGINKFLRPFRRDTTKLKGLITIFKENNYLDGKTYVENLLGIQYRNFSHYQKAITIHKQALETAKKANSIEFKVFSLNMLGVDYRKIDANRTALDYNYEALKLAETVDNPSLGLRRSIAVSLNSMGNIYLLLKQYSLAIERFKKSQEIERSINNKLGLAINYQNIGYAKDAQGKTEEALDYFKKSLNLNNKLKNTYGQIICKSSIANLYIKQGKPQKAINLIKENIETAEKMGNIEYLAYEYLSLGWAQSRLNQFSEAETNLNKGLKIAKKHNFSSALSYAYSHFSELYQSKKDYKSALKYYKISENFENTISNERTIQYVNDLIIKYDSERQDNEIKNLAKQNEITQLKLIKNRNIWIIIIVTLTLFIAVLYFLYRQRLLKKEKRILTLEQDVLRTQMNPHFIFNALNSIKHYIINNEQKNAVHYLNKFSKLVRKILESSTLKEVSLQEELETMDLYMNIENIRFSNEINFEINVDNTLDLSTINVPPLVLQPFLENALWHGLSSKKGDKKITLSVFKPSKDFIEINIEDNGIGRKASAKIKSNKFINRKSIGIKLTKERLHNFIKDFKNPFSLVFNDLINDDKTSRGTKVALKIPLK